MAAMSFVECKRSMLVLLLFQLLSKEKYKCYKMRGGGGGAGVLQNAVFD